MFLSTALEGSRGSLRHRYFSPHPETSPTVSVFHTETEGEQGQEVQFGTWRLPPDFLP